MSNSEQQNDRVVLDQTDVDATEGKYTVEKYQKNLATFDVANSTGTTTEKVILKTKAALEWGSATDLITDEELETRLDMLARADCSKLEKTDYLDALTAKDGLETIIRKTKYKTTLKVLTNEPDKANYYHVGAFFSNAMELSKHNEQPETLKDDLKIVQNIVLPEVALNQFRDNMLQGTVEKLKIDLNAPDIIKPAIKQPMVQLN